MSLYQGLVLAALGFIGLGLFSLAGNLGVLTKHNLRFKPEDDEKPSLAGTKLEFGVPVLVYFQGEEQARSLVCSGTDPANGALLLNTFSA